MAGSGYDGYLGGIMRETGTDSAGVGGFSSGSGCWMCM